MFFIIKFLKSDIVNGVQYKKGQTLRVSRSIRDSKIKNNIAKDIPNKDNDE